MKATYDKSLIRVNKTGVLFLHEHVRTEVLKIDDSQPAFSDAIVTPLSGVSTWSENALTLGKHFLLKDRSYSIIDILASTPDAPMVLHNLS